MEKEPSDSHPQVLVDVFLVLMVIATYAGEEPAGISSNIGPGYTLSIINKRFQLSQGLNQNPLPRVGPVLVHKDATCKVQSVAGPGKLHRVCAPGFQRVKGALRPLPQASAST